MYICWVSSSGSTCLHTPSERDIVPAQHAGFRLPVDYRLPVSQEAACVAGITCLWLLDHLLTPLLSLYTNGCISSPRFVKLLKLVDDIFLRGFISSEDESDRENHRLQSWCWFKTENALKTVEMVADSQPYLPTSPCVNITFEFTCLLSIHSFIIVLTYILIYLLLWVMTTVCMDGCNVRHCDNLLGRGSDDQWWNYDDIICNKQEVKSVLPNIFWFS